MQRRWIIIIGSVIIGIMAVAIANIYLEKEKESIKRRAREEIARRQETQTSVLVAKNDIPKGTTIQSEHLESRVIPKEYVQPQVVSYPERIMGMITIAPISQGEQITLSKLLMPKQQGGVSSLAMATPVGKRAISIPVDNISSLMGMVRPGDYVDVIGMVPVPVSSPDGKTVTSQAAVIPLFQNVLVLAVGNQLGESSASAESSRYNQTRTAEASQITLALSSQEANLLAFVQEQGKIRLVLRSPADSRIEPVQPASWEALFQYLMPQAKEQASARQETQLAPKEKPREVEIYRGLKRETMPLSN